LADVGTRDEGGRRAVGGQAFNISARAWETLEAIGEALCKEYGLKGINWVNKASRGTDSEVSVFLSLVTGYSQWVGSEKLRKVTGYSDKRLLFTEGIKAYRGSYEVLMRDGNEGGENVRSLLLKVKEMYKANQKQAAE